MLKSWCTALTVTALLASGLAVAGLLPVDSTQESTMVLASRNGERGYGPMQFRLEGAPVRNLYPGIVKQMKLTVVNPNDFRLQLQNLTGTGFSTRPGCPATSANLVVKQYSGRLPVTIEPRRRVVLGGYLPVGMPWGAAQKCAGAQFTISVSGVGKRMSR